MTSDGQVQDQEELPGQLVGKATKDFYTMLDSKGQDQQSHPSKWIEQKITLNQKNNPVFRFNIGEPRWILYEKSKI